LGPEEVTLPAWQAFFFDFDGVLADSVEVKTRAFALLFEPYGPEVMAKVVDHHRRHGGMTRFDKFRHYFREFLGKPLDEAGLADLCRRFSQLVVDEVVASPAIPGSVAFLERWHQKVPCFVVSATPEDEIHAIVRRRGLTTFFKGVAGAPPSKKEIIQRFLTQYKLTGAKCLFFGDAESDYRAAQAWGVNFLAILPNESAPLLRVAPEISWVRDFNQIKLSEK
jgi:HAD superfamily hydrolase (TIGR01549 family)